jgi:hypothetical protein
MLGIPAGTTGIPALGTFATSRHWEDAKFGTGANLGIVYLGIGATGAVGANTYTVRVDARTGDTSQVGISSVTGGTATPPSVTLIGRNFLTGSSLTSSGGISSTAGSGVAAGGGTMVTFPITGVGTGVTDLTVTNPGSVGYSGTFLMAPFVPVELSVFTAN